jgi:hypothetical protein
MTRGFQFFVPDRVGDPLPGTTITLIHLAKVFSTITDSTGEAAKVFPLQP